MNQNGFPKPKMKTWDLIRSVSSSVNLMNTALITRSTYLQLHCIYLTLRCVQSHLPTWASKIDLCLPFQFHLPWASGHLRSVAPCSKQESIFFLIGINRWEHSLLIYLQITRSITNFPSTVVSLLQIMKINENDHDLHYRKHGSLWCKWVRILFLLIMKIFLFERSHKRCIKIHVMYNERRDTCKWNPWGMEII